MRVIAGKARRLPLVSPEGRGTRPTTDRIKETLFNILQDDIPGCRFLDLFSGSGAIGIEAISRGAKEAVFVEFGKENIAPCKDIQRVHQIHTNNTAFIIPYYHVVDNFGSMSVSDTCIIRIFYPLDLAGLQGLNFFRRGIYAVNLQNDFPAVG